MVPTIDVREDAKSITIEADLPGVDEKDVSVTLANGVLTIKGEKKHEREREGELLPCRAQLRQLRAVAEPSRYDR